MQIQPRAGDFPTRLLMNDRALCPPLRASVKGVERGDIIRPSRSIRRTKLIDTALINSLLEE